MKQLKKLIAAMLIILIFLCMTGCNTDKIENALGPYISMESKETKIYNKAVDDFFAAVDKKDTKAIKKLFLKSIQEDENFQSDIEDFLEFYHGPTDKCERDGRHVNGRYGSEFGVNTAAIGSNFAVISNDTTYYCSFSIVYENEENPDEVGIDGVDLVTEKVRCSDDFKWNSDPGIHIIEDCDGDYETRRIGGFPYQYTSIDRTITEKEVKDFVKKSKSYNEFKEEFGEPNADDIAHIYELAG